MNESEKECLEVLLGEVVKSNNADKNYGAIKAAIGLLPGVGGAVAEFYSTYISPPATKRLYEFLEKLIGELRSLQSQVNGFTVESLQKNPVFITALMQAIEIAIRNHQEEKLKALRNLILNSVLSNSVEDDVKLLFFDWLNEFKVSHLHLLHILHEPDRYREKAITLKELQTNKYLYGYFLKELIDKGLVFFEEFYTKADAIVQEEDDYLSHLLPKLPPVRFPSPMPSPYTPKKRMKVKLRQMEETSRNIDWLIQLIKNNKSQGYTTEFGNLFIQFISSPVGGSPKN